MENLSLFVKGYNQVNEEKLPPRVCPRCNSNNTKFCYYNNYNVSQPRYICKNCRRYWTHGGALKNIPIGESSRKIKRTKRDQPSMSQVVSAETQQVNHHIPFLHVQDTSEFVGSFGGSSAAVPFGNHFGSLPVISGDMVLPTRSFQPIDRPNFHGGPFQQYYYDVGSNDLIGSPLTNQSIGGSIAVSSGYNGYRNQYDQNNWNQSFNNTMNMNQNNWNQSFNNSMNTNHNASTSGNRGCLGTDHMNKNNNKIINNCVFKSFYHLENHGP